MRFLLPLLAGFLFAWASAFTAAWSRRWGEGGGRLISAVLRNLLGIPLYFLGLVLAWRSPAPLLADPGGVGVGLGWLLIGAGAIPVALGHWQLGRLTHLPSQSDALMERGLYARVRHPIYAGGLAIIAGLALLRPTAPWLLACGLAIAFLVIQARLEEIDLLQRMPAYRVYQEQVPAWLPRLPGLGAWVWLCPALGILLAAGVLWIFRLSWWSALLAALMLVCPVILLWGARKLREPPDRDPSR